MALYRYEHIKLKQDDDRNWNSTRQNRSKRFLVLAVFLAALIFVWRFPVSHSDSAVERKHPRRSSSLGVSTDHRSVQDTTDVEHGPSARQPYLKGQSRDGSTQATHNEHPRFLHEVTHVQQDLLDEDALPGEQNVLQEQRTDQHRMPSEPHAEKLRAEKELEEEDLERPLHPLPKAEVQLEVPNLQDLPKAPVAVDAGLDPDTQSKPLIASPDQPAKEKIIETESEAHLTLEIKADNLPEIIHIPFEEVLSTEKLHGWEEDWVAHGSYDAATWGKLDEPKVDFVYLWVNGSEEAFQTTKRPYELNSVLNDEDGNWISSHGVNRYRDWDELRYSLRSLEKYAASFRNKIQIIVNSVPGVKGGKQIPTWLNEDQATSDVVQVLSQEEIFDEEKHVCLPTFNSLTIENQLFNTKSDTDYLFAMSDDMLLGRPHAPSDIVSPLFGPVMGFKTNAYNAIGPPSEADLHRFGEKPFLIYTSWLLNRRFGIRKRKGQGHFGHSLSRSVMREAISSFPGPELQSACKRFRGEPGFQLYSWYATFHYVIERHREALLWSYIMLRSDRDGDGSLGWDERQAIMAELEAGMVNEGKTSFRKRNFYHVRTSLHRAGLEPPKVNLDIQWTSLDGPMAIQGLDCSEFDLNECLAPGFSIGSAMETRSNPSFSTALVFDRLNRQEPRCGDCLLKLILNQKTKGLSPLLPDETTQATQRETVVKAMMRYRYTIINPDALFVMVTDAEQVDSTLVNRFVRDKKQLAGQLCLNDDVSTEDEQELKDVKQAMTELYQGLFPEKSAFEL